LALYGGEWSDSRPGRFTPRERAPGTDGIGGWVGPTADLTSALHPKPDEYSLQRPNLFA